VGDSNDGEGWEGKGAGKGKGRERQGHTDSSPQHLVKDSKTMNIK